MMPFAGTGPSVLGRETGEVDVAEAFWAVERLSEPGMFWVLWAIAYLIHWVGELPRSRVGDERRKSKRKGES